MTAVLRVFRVVLVRIASDIALVECRLHGTKSKRVA